MEQPSPPVTEEGLAIGIAHPPARGASSVDQRVRTLRRLDRIFRGATGAVTAGVVLLVAALTAVLVGYSWPAILRFGLGFLSGTTWDGVHDIYGALPAIVGTLLTSALALLIAVPLALGVAIFLSEIAPPWLREPLVYLVDVTAAIPSVVFGFWAFIVLVPVMRTRVEPTLSDLTGGRFLFSGLPLGLDLLTATLVLSVMVLPTIAALSREALRAVPRLQRESALSLGATRWEATRLAVLGPARAGIAGGVILGLGRALGETIAVTMVIGNIYALPTSLFSPAQTLGSQIASTFDSIPPSLQLDALVELGVILFAIAFAVNVVARVLIRRWQVAEGSAPRRSGPIARHLRFAPRVLARYAHPDSTTEVAHHEWHREALPGLRRRIGRRRVVEWIMIALCAASVIVALVPFSSILVTAVSKGGAALLQPSFYTSEPPLPCNPGRLCTYSLGGIGPMIEGSLIMLAIGALVAMPIGILGGIYLSEYGRGSSHRGARFASFLSDVLAGVPTILIGIFAFLIFLEFYHDAARSALTGGVALGFVMIPIVVRSTEEALRTVPDGVREAALALGFPRHRVGLRVVLGSARSAVVTGALLGLSRAAGDTAALVVTAGGSQYWATSLTQPTASLTPFIFEYFNSSYLNWQTDAWGAVLILLIVMLGISLVARIATRQKSSVAEVG